MMNKELIELIKIQQKFNDDFKVSVEKDIAKGNERIKVNEEGMNDLRRLSKSVEVFTIFITNFTIRWEKTYFTI